MLGDSDIVVIEMVVVFGLYYVLFELCNLFNIISYGIGELIVVVLECGVKCIILGIGGSVMNDGGVGMM